MPVPLAVSVTGDVSTTGGVHESPERLTMLQVLLERRGDSLAVAGGQQIEQQPAGDRHSEPGFPAGGGHVRPCLDEFGRDAADPRFDDRFKESLSARPA
jgi:hypothetical protein